MRMLAAVLAVLFLILQGQFWLGQGGMRDLWQLQRAVQAQQDENATLEERNASLAAEVEDLKSGLKAVEERARTELGMVKRGETFYQVTDDLDVARKTTSKQPDIKPAAGSAGNVSPDPAGGQNQDSPKDPPNE